MAADPPLWIFVRITGMKEAGPCHYLYCQGVSLVYFSGLFLVLQGSSMNSRAYMKVSEFKVYPVFSLNALAALGH